MSQRDDYTPPTIWLIQLLPLPELERILTAIDRTIRFKEWGVYVDTTKRPKPEQIPESDGTLKDLDFALRTDSNGFIITGNSLSNPGAQRKIVMLGDSFVESLYSDENLRFAARVELELQKGATKYQVWNGGYSGSTLLHSFNVFVNKIVPLLPYVERTLFFTAMSDQRTQVNKRSYWLQDKTHAPIVESRNGIAPEDRPAASDEQSKLLKTVVYLSRQFEHEPTIVLTPYRSAPHENDAFIRKIFPDKTTYQKYLDRLEMINETARDIASQLGVPVIDAAGALNGHAEYFYDTLHLNSKGQEIMANFLTREISKIVPS